MLLRLLIILTTLVLGPTLAMAQERIWNLDRTDQEAYLVFGVPETDDVGVSFWCTIQSGTVQFSVPEIGSKLKIADNVLFDLEISTNLYHLKGKILANEEIGSTILASELKATDLLFTALQNASWFSVKLGSIVRTYPLLDADFYGFLEVCKNP